MNRAKEVSKDGRTQREAAGKSEREREKERGTENESSREALRARKRTKGRWSASGEDGASEKVKKIEGDRG